MKMLVWAESRPLMGLLLRRRSGGCPFEEPTVNDKMP
jgi:hypothetical protein